MLTGADAARLSGPIRPLIPTTAAVPDYCLAVDRVRYAGEPVAAVAAVDRATAEDALELIRVEYDPLPAVVDPEEALKPGAPLLYPELGTNVVWHDTLSYGDVDGAMARAHGVLRERFTIQRYASTPLETFGAMAAYDPGTDAFEFWTNDQRPGLTISILAASLGVPQSRIRLSCPDIGGAFGNKRRPAYLLICALLARKSGRPVKWIEDRIENLTALMHACNGVMDVELAYAADGTLLALSVRDISDEGKNLLTPTQHNLIKLGNIANGYRIPAIRYEAWSVLTTKCPSGANRGIGKPFMCFAVERSMAILARRLGLDPAELRLRNYVTAAEMPYTTPPGAQYDSGDYPATLRLALERFGYAGWRAEQARARHEGRLLGIGIATSIEPAGTNLASYELITGRRTRVGIGRGRDGPHGAGRQRARVHRRSGQRAGLRDRHRADRGRRARAHPGGRRGRPGLRLGDDTLALSLGQLLEQVLRHRRGRDRGRSPPRGRQAAPARRASARDRPGRSRAARRRRRRARSAGPARSRSPELARTAYADVLGLPPGEEPGLEARHAYQNPLAAPVDADRRVRSQLVFSNAAHCCLVEVHPRTGVVTLLKYLVVHDCGREMNPLIVEGMVHGSTVHGIGAALLEEFRYDEQGQLLTSTFLDYLKPTATDVPTIEVERLEHPSPFTPLGAKGVGEGGAIPGPAAVANAVEDALAPFGVTVRSLPITPERVWRWIAPGKAP